MINIVLVFVGILFVVSNLVFIFILEFLNLILEDSFLVFVEWLFWGVTVFFINR